MKNFRCKHKNYVLYIAFEIFFKKFTAKKTQKFENHTSESFSSVLQNFFVS